MTRSLPKQLIDQAEHLVRKEPKRPRQASLRRAVSAAYYALFHFLTDEACRLMLGTAHQRRKLRTILSRAFVHSTMKNASKTFAGGNLPASMSTSVGPVPNDLRSVADAFVKLQEERHRADYDWSKPFTCTEANRLIHLAKRAFQLWTNLKNHDAARLYLVSLMVWDQLKGK